jgi:Rps23 Pro-64 3,4-dihydroxylase Tpa1-like proline 4-hydroxylase
MIDQIYYWDEFLTLEEYEKVATEFNDSVWEFKGMSKDSPESRMIWYKEMEGCAYTRSLFKQKIESFTGKKIITERLYANGQAHGQCGNIHKDVPDEQKTGHYGTIVYYIHPEWKPIYGGNLFFTNEEETAVTGTFFPKTNSALMFDSRMKHCALEPTVYCTEQRISLAMKFKFKTPLDAEEIILDEDNLPEGRLL